MTREGTSSTASTVLCAICGTRVYTEPDAVHRELRVCGNCGSTPRFCGLALAVSRAIWGSPDRCLAERPPRHDVVAIGLSDADRLARLFREKLNYTNTFYHAEPRLDLCSAESCAAYSADLIICSDVIEHTMRPPALTLPHLFNMLRPGGTLILSAPTYVSSATIEWYGGAEKVDVH